MGEKHTGVDAGLSADYLVLGIDTGGTFTDGVLLRYRSRQVLASKKSLTTKRDLSIGIEEVIEGIHIEDPEAVKLVSISTTLATNAIAEGKGKRVALLLIGYDPELIATFKMAQRLATPHYFFFAGGHDLYGREKEELDLSAILVKVNEIKDQVDAFAVSSYFSPLNPEHEIRIYRSVSRICDLPIVLGHQLSSKLGSVERATTAALNASLLAVLQDFVIAVRRAMERRQIDAPLMVVRGDGTLMSDEFAARTPVETIHSGPAASAIGGRFLSKLDDALVIDIGGTTTDIALIQAGEVDVNEEGAMVGDYKTAVKAANLLSIALGGDSHVTLNREREIVIGPERVVPLAYMANQYPRLKNKLKSMARRSLTPGSWSAWSRSTPDCLEFWFLLRKPQEMDFEKGLQERAAALVEFLVPGPRSVPEIKKHFDVLHVTQIPADELLMLEIVGKGGLTATDLLHVDGHYAPWDAEAAAIALDVFSRFLGVEPVEVSQLVRRSMNEAIVQAIVTFLSGKQINPPVLRGDDDMGRWFFLNSLYRTHPHLETSFRLRQPIIGIGAPAGIFLPDLADLLNTDLILPVEHQVANAVGAVAGSVMVTEELVVYPRISSDGLDVVGYYVQAKDKRDEFESLDEALDYARSLGEERAIGAAVRSGADNPQVVVEETVDGLDTYRIRARAMGTPRLAR